jgi:hypothetical protein
MNFTFKDTRGLPWGGSFEPEHSTIHTLAMAAANYPNMFEYVKKS